MIYKFRMISAEDKAFLRDYEVDASQSFLTFHQAIQENLGYDPSQLASFFLSDEHWNKGLELTLIDMENDAGPAAIPMDSVKIKELIKCRRERLLYVYDIFADKAFFLELIDIQEPSKKHKYPYCSASVGEAPLQLGELNVPMEQFGGSDDSPFDNLMNDYNSDDFGFADEPFEGDEE